MSAHDDVGRRPEASAPAAAEPGRSLLERLRAFLGLEPASARDDIEDALAESGASTEFTPQERAILKNVLALHDVRVADVMVPRADIVSVNVDATIGELLALFRTAGHSRLPVYGETLDDPRGMIHIRDFMDFLASEPAFGLIAQPAEGEAKAQRGQDVGMDTPLAAAHILRPVLFAPPSMPALDLLVKMQASRTHMALVIDEYGGTDGLVSIEDVVESIVGDIEDEHDEADRPQIAAAGDGVFVVEARAGLEDVSKALGVDLSDLAVAEDVDTIGGLLTATAGRVPSRGEIVAGPADLEFEVLDADPRRVKRLRLRKRPQPRRRNAARSAAEGDGAAVEAGRSGETDSSAPSDDQAPSGHA